MGRISGVDDDCFSVLRGRVSGSTAVSAPGSVLEGLVLVAFVVTVLVFLVLVSILVFPASPVFSSPMAISGGTASGAGASDTSGISSEGEGAQLLTMMRTNDSTNNGSGTSFFIKRRKSRVLINLHLKKFPAEFFHHKYFKNPSSLGSFNIAFTTIGQGLSRVCSSSTLVKPELLIYFINVSQSSSENF